MVTSLMMSAKLPSLGFLKIKAFQVNCQVNNKIVSRNANYIVDVIM